MLPTRSIILRVGNNPYVRQVRMNPTPEALRALNIALDRKRRMHDFANDTELAKHLGVSAKTLSFWRNGRWTKGDQALIAVLTGHQTILVPAETTA